MAQQPIKLKAQPFFFFFFKRLTAHLRQKCLALRLRKCLEPHRRPEDCQKKCRQELPESPEPPESGLPEQQREEWKPEQQKRESESSSSSSSSVWLLRRFADRRRFRLPANRQHYRVAVWRAVFCPSCVGAKLLTWRPAWPRRQEARENSKFPNRQILSLAPRPPVERGEEDDLRREAWREKN